MISLPSGIDNPTEASSPVPVSRALSGSWPLPAYPPVLLLPVLPASLSTDIALGHPSFRDRSLVIRLLMARSPRCKCG